MTAASTVELTGDDLAAIEGRLDITGLFAAHAHTDVTRLLAEIHRLRQALADPPADDPASSHPADDDDQGAHR